MCFLYYLCFDSICDGPSLPPHVLYSPRQQSAGDACQGEWVLSNTVLKAKEPPLSSDQVHPICL